MTDVQVRELIDVRFGLRAIAAQFSLLVGLNAFVGAMVGLERSVLPLVGEHDFGLRSKAAIMAFVVAFGVAKAVTNLAAGGLAERVGRKHLLTIGWLVAVPVPVMIGLAQSWTLVVAANILLGLNQSAGYLGVAASAFVTGALAASYAPRTVVWAASAAIAGLGLAVSVLFVRDTGAHVALEQRRHTPGDRAQTLRTAFAHATLHDPVL